MKNFFIALLSATLLFAVSAAFSQNVNVAPAANTYPNLGAAFTAINGGAHGAGAITVSIVGNTVEAAPAILNGGVFTSCSITPNGARTVGGNFNEAVIVLDGADNVSIDGLNTAGNSLTIANPNTGTAQGCIRLSNGAQNNSLKNLVCNGVGVGTGQGGRTINIAQSTAAVGNNNNLIENCLVNGGRRGIQTFGTAALVTNDGTIIRNCIVKNCSSLAIFIGSETRDNTVERCQIFNDAAIVAGADLRGINVQGVGNNNVIANRVYILNSSTVADFIGILVIPVLLTAPGSNATTVRIVNNMVSITDNNIGSGSILGIYPSSIPGTTVPYTCTAVNNSSLVSGTDATAAAAFNAAFYSDNLEAGSVTRIFNNIALNTRSGGDSTTQNIGGYIDNDAVITLDADYNIWSATDAATGWDGGFDGFLYNNINLHRQAACNPGTTLRELHTVFSTTFSFTSATDLHLVASSLGGSINGSPSTDAPTDIDGDVRSATLPYRGADELAAGLFKSFTLTVGMEGSMPGPYDIVTVGLANSTSPYALVALATNHVNTGSTTTVMHFGGAIPNGTPYYVIAFHRNHLETWSANTVTFAGGAASYNFTTSVAQAYGSNQVIEGGIARTYGADVNQDGTIDASDGADIDNDAFNFVSGNQILSDVTNDGSTDASDAVYSDNNAFNFIGVVKPPAPNSLTADDGLRSSGKQSTTVSNNLRKVSLQN